MSDGVRAVARWVCVLLLAIGAGALSSMLGRPLGLFAQLLGMVLTLVGMFYVAKTMYWDAGKPAFERPPRWITWPEFAALYAASVFFWAMTSALVGVGLIIGTTLEPAPYLMACGVAGALGLLSTITRAASR
jgi:hypothetical protein